MAKLNKSAASALSDLSALLKQWLEDQIAALSPRERSRFEEHFARGLTRYDALMETLHPTAADLDEALMGEPDLPSL